MSADKKRSGVWNHFAAESNGRKATCHHCLKSISIAGGSTSNLLRHLLLVHPRAASVLTPLKSPPSIPSMTVPPFSAPDKEDSNLSNTVTIEVQLQDLPVAVNQVIEGLRTFI